METTTRRVVREIPALYMGAKQKVEEKLRLGYYARVSTLNEEQEDSYENQKEFFTKIINNRPDWKLVGEYADWGTTGTKTEGRKEFNRMMEDCRAGKLDRILVKSISRFARNTVDTLQCIRELKELGISVWFDNERIDTMTAGGDVLITILAAMAEQESRTMSTNIKWAYQKRFKDGKVIINYRSTLGYTKDPDGDGYIIVEEEARLVQRIFREYLSGRTYRQISDTLNAEGITTKHGNKWKPSAVDRMLSNEKYTGNAILGKTFKPDVLSKSRKKNDGTAPMYYVENSHPMIITQTMFDMVQAEKKRRTELRSSVKTGAGKYSSRYGFSGLLVCGDCGGKFRRFGRKLANGEYVPTWVCVNHQKDKHRCTMKPLKEMDIYDAYRRAVERLLGNADDIISIIKTNIEEEFATTKEESLEKVSAELIKKQEEIMRMFRRKSCGEVDDETYNQAYAELSREVMALQEQETKLKEMNTKAAIEKQKQMDILAILNEGKAHYMENEVMRMLIETIKVINKHSVEFQFKCGVNIIEKV